MKLLPGYYKNDLPEEGDLIYGTVSDISEYGINISLIEYPVTGYLSFKEASVNKRLKAIKQELRVNKDYVFTVISVNPEKRFVDLSRKNHTVTEEKEFIDYLKKYRSCLSVVSEFCRIKDLLTHDEQVDCLNRILWKFVRTEAYNIFKDIKKSDTNMEKFDIDKEDNKNLHSIISKFIKDVSYTFKINFKLNSLDVDGRQSIIDYLNLIEKTIKDASVYILSAPLYIVEWNTVSEYEIDKQILEKKDMLNDIPRNDKLFMSIQTVEKYEE
jgi:translation initiation factor 2 alpha subunit (eIF-2alpha)